MKVPRSRFYQWLIMITIFLAACAPVSSEIPGGGGEAIVGETTATPTSEERGVEDTPTPTSGNESNNAGLVASGNGLTVAILVVDFFNDDVNEDRGDSNNCLAATTGSEGAGQSGSTGAANGVVKSAIPHGEMVYAHLREQFAPNASFTTIPSEEFPNTQGLLLAEEVVIDQGIVYLAKINIGDNFTDAVLDQITSAHDTLQNNFGVNYFVVNMSVVIKPCGTMFDDDEQYLQFVQCIPLISEQRSLLNVEGNEDVEAIVRPHAEIAAAYYANPFGSWDEEPGTIIGCLDNSGAVDALASVIRRSADFYLSLIDDPLLEAAFDTPGASEDTFYIAASGNDGYPYPFAPAIFNNVVSVGAAAPLSETLTYTPNAAEWVWNDRYKFEVPADNLVKIFEGGITKEILGGEVITMSGTSFAAPKLSYLTAIALMIDSPIPDCYIDMTYAAGKLQSSPDIFRWGELQNSGIDPSTIWLNDSAGNIGGVCNNFPNPSITKPPRP